VLMAGISSTFYATVQHYHQKFASLNFEHPFQKLGLVQELSIGANTSWGL